jgi:hypothetical protein
MQFKSLSRWAVPIVIGLAVLCLRYAPTAVADTTDRLASLQINVWPEYDDARVLVMYDGEVADTSNLPRDISVFIPSTAALNAAAYVDANGSFITIPGSPTTQDTGDGFLRVTIKLPAPKFHLEYYYNPLQGSTDKSMEFVYKAAQPAENVQLDIQQPLKSDKFATDPVTQVKTTDPHNFTFYVFNYASMDAGQTQRIKVSYTKTDPNPSIASIPQPASSPANTQSATPANSLMPSVLIAVALALVALGGFAWWSRGRNALRLSPAEADVPRRKQRRRGTPSTGLGAGFCVQCGRELEEDDIFCPRCGTRRRNS